MVGKTEYADGLIDPFLASISPEKRRQILMWTLLVTGALLVCWSESLGRYLVSHPDFGWTTVTWNPEDAHAVASSVRVLGSMSFAAGLVERLRSAIVANKTSE